MVIASATQRGRTLALNGVCGNIGISLAAGITAPPDRSAVMAWRLFVPGAVCIATGATYLWLIPDEIPPRTGSPDASPDVFLFLPSQAAIFGLFVVVALCAGLVFNTLSVALPKIVDERVSNYISLIEIGGLTTAVFICGAIAQMAVGRLVERFHLLMLFAVLAAMQFRGVVWTAYASGFTVLFALAFTMAAIYGQITVNDLIIARYTADAWRGRVYAVRYFLTFAVSGAAVSLIAVLYGRGGFPEVPARQLSSRSASSSRFWLSLTSRAASKERRCPTATRGMSSRRNFSEPVEERRRSGFQRVIAGDSRTTRGLFR